MKRVSFNPRFVNGTGDDLVPGKIHTIRASYSFWKKFEGRDMELFTWEGKPYRSKQKVFCVKRLVYVQRVEIWHIRASERHKMWPKFYMKSSRPVTEKTDVEMRFPLSTALLAANDGFDDEEEFLDWFYDYPPVGVAILHFTDFRYGA
jgi:hypothetical protein